MARAFLTSLGNGRESSAVNRQRPVLLSGSAAVRDDRAMRPTSVFQFTGACGFPAVQGCLTPGRMTGTDYESSYRQESLAREVATFRIIA